MFGFLAFNGGSQASISEYEDGVKVATAVKNTIISGSFSAIVTLVVNKVVGNELWSLLLTINGALAGMVGEAQGRRRHPPHAINRNDIQTNAEHGVAVS